MIGFDCLVLTILILFDATNLPVSSSVSTDVIKHESSWFTSLYSNLFGKSIEKKNELSNSHWLISFFAF